jgi:hypothetical protein
MKKRHITVPNHNSIRLGTLSTIFVDIASDLKKTKEEIAEEIFR